MHQEDLITVDSQQRVSGISLIVYDMQGGPIPPVVEEIVEQFSETLANTFKDSRMLSSLAISVVSE